MLKDKEGQRNFSLGFICIFFHFLSKNVAFVHKTPEDYVLDACTRTCGEKKKTPSAPIVFTVHFLLATSLAHTWIKISYVFSLRRSCWDFFLPRTPLDSSYMFDKKKNVRATQLHNVYLISYRLCGQNSTDKDLCYGRVFKRERATSNRLVTELLLGPLPWGSSTGLGLWKVSYVTLLSTGIMSAVFRFLDVAITAATGNFCNFFLWIQSLQAINVFCYAVALLSNSIFTARSYDFATASIFWRKKCMPMVYLNRFN